jgi:hypothetical protein
MEVFDSIGAADGLVPIFISPYSGEFTSRVIHIMVSCSRHYASLSKLTVAEYLIKQYLQTLGPVYLDVWEAALREIQKHLVIPTKHAKLSVIAELPNGIGGELDHLVCFLPGSIELGATSGMTEAETRLLPSFNTEKAQQMKLTKKLTRTCRGKYKVTQTGIAPEIV